MLSLISARRAGKQTTEEWAPHSRPDHVAQLQYLQSRGVRGRSHWSGTAERRLFGIISSEVIVTLQSASSGPQYAAKTKPIYCLGRGAVVELIFNAEMSRANISQQYKDKI